MTYEIDRKWDPYIVESEDADGALVMKVKASTPAAILAEIKDLDAEVFEIGGYHPFVFEGGDPT